VKRVDREIIHFFQRLRVRLFNVSRRLAFISRRFKPGIVTPVVVVGFIAVAGSVILSQSQAATSTIGSVATVPDNLGEVRALPAPDNTQIAIFQSDDDSDPGTEVWYMARLGSTATRPYTGAVTAPGYVQDMAVGSDSTVYLIVIRFWDPGGMLLKIKPGATSAEIVRSWDSQHLRNVEFYKDKIYMFGQEAVAGTCTGKITVFDGDGAELKTIDNPLGCTGNWRAASNALVGYDTDSNRVAYLNPDTQDIRFQTFTSYWNTSLPALGADGSMVYSTTTDFGCTGTHIIRVSPTGQVYDIPLSQVFPNQNLGEGCSIPSLAMLSDNTTAIMISDYRSRVVQVKRLDANGTVMNTPISDESSELFSSLTADGSGKFILAVQKYVECSPDIAVLGSKRCSSLHVNLYDANGLLSSYDAGGQWEYSISQTARPSVKDGSIGIPVHVRQCEDCIDERSVDVVQIAAPVKRVVFDELVVDPLVDTDGDALPDEWEINGHNGIDLKAMGADPLRADLFVHLDWMKGPVDGVTYDMSLSSEAIRKVVESFDKSPYVNPNKPDGVTLKPGVNLHVDHGPNSIMNFKTNKTWGTLSQAQPVTMVPVLGYEDDDGNYYWDDFDALKGAKFTHTNRRQVFHYAVAAYKYPDSPNTYGIARNTTNAAMYGADFLLTLGNLPKNLTAAQKLVYQSSVFMHELGHNLNLRHGGADNIHNKPNYISIMNYSFLDHGLFKGDIGGYVDYSNKELPTLYERSLDETAGIGPSLYGSARYYHLPFFNQNGWFVPIKYPDAFINWNWNFSDTDKTALFNINGDFDENGTEILDYALRGHNDWANIRFNNGVTGKATVIDDLPLVTPGEDPAPDPETVIDPSITYDFKGFYSPVSNYPSKNSVSAGTTVPVKFSLGGNKGLDVFLKEFPSSRKVSCSTLESTNKNDLAVRAVSTNFTYDASKDQYNYVWRTDKTWKGTCREFAVMLKDGTRRSAVFQFK
jgi:hypothetical protein